MKKLLFILTLFISTTSFAQTKEETIAWINTYGLEMLGYSKNGINNFSVTEDGDITIQSGQITNNNEKLLSQNTLFNVKDIILSDNEIVFDGASYNFFIQTNGNKIKIYNGNYISKISIWSKDKNNLERLANAINHLAKLCGAKEKPIENTF